jgi:hypothetical protein
MPFAVWNKTTQAFQNGALYSSETEALEYIARLDEAHTVQRDDVPEFVAVELPVR